MRRSRRACEILLWRTNRNFAAAYSYYTRRHTSKPITIRIWVSAHPPCRRRMHTKPHTLDPTHTHEHELTGESVRKGIISWISFYLFVGIAMSLYVVLSWGASSVATLHSIACVCFCVCMSLRIARWYFNHCKWVCDRRRRQRRWTAATAAVVVVIAADDDDDDGAVVAICIIWILYVYLYEWICALP